MLESEYQAKLKKKLRRLFPEAVVIKNDANDIQGIPDLTIFYKDRWAMLECKRSADSRRQPNQEYYVELMNSMSFARFIFPENEAEVLHDLERSLKAPRSACISQCIEIPLD